MHIIQISSESLPFVKTGGLGEVVGALSEALAEQGHKVSLIIPYHTSKISLKKFKIRDVEKAVKVSIADNEVAGEIHASKLGPNLTAYLLKQDHYYNREELYQTPEGDYKDNAERFIFFTKASLELIRMLNMAPDIIHIHDWQSALVAVYHKTLYKNVAPNAKVLLTIHNLGYQGLFSYQVMPLTGLGWEHFTFDKLEFYGKANFLKGGIMSADAINTVSKKYKEEILTPEYSCGLDGALKFREKDLYGIINGIDCKDWNPEKDPLIPARYNSKSLVNKAICKASLQKYFKLPQMPRVPLIGMISRLTSQKGFDLLEATLPRLMDNDLQIVILGTGEKRYHEMLLKCAKEYPTKIGVRIAFDNTLAHLIEAGSDFFLMPSKYEPCGLNQMISLRYGTIPIVRATGGLDDTIIDGDNGFKFAAYEPSGLIDAITRALEVYQNPERFASLVANAFKYDFSWGRSADEYVELYKRLMVYS